MTLLPGIREKDFRTMKTLSKAAFLNEATGNHYTVEVDAKTGERKFINVYLDPKFEHNYKIANNAKKSKYVVCECELRKSQSGNEYYKEVIDQRDVLKEAGRD